MLHYQIPLRIGCVHVPLGLDGAHFTYSRVSFGSPKHRSLVKRTSFLKASNPGYGSGWVAFSLDV